MKKIYNILMLFYCVSLNAQFTVNIGNDTSYCVGLFLHEPDTAYIGSKVNITGGSPPYEFAWSCEAKVSENLIFTASDFLNDTTVLNPFFKDTYFNGYWLEFILKVNDSNGFVSYDKINIRFSSFIYNLQYYVLETKREDSVQFYGLALIGDGISPISYTWEPSESLSDPHDLAAYASPDTTTEYWLSAIDSLGCYSDTFPYYKVVVNQGSGMENLMNNNEKPTINYNGKNISIGLHEKYCNKGLTIKLLSLDGKKQYSNLITGCNHIIYLTENEQSGIYIMALFIGDKLLYADKILIK